MSREKIPQDTAVTRNIPQDMEGGEAAGVRGIIGADSGEELRGVTADGIASVTPNLGRQEIGVRLEFQLSVSPLFLADPASQVAPSGLDDLLHFWT